MFKKIGEAFFKPRRLPKNYVLKISNFQFFYQTVEITVFIGEKLRCTIICSLKALVKIDCLKSTKDLVDSLIIKKPSNLVTFIFYWLCTEIYLSPVRLHFHPKHSSQHLLLTCAPSFLAHTTQLFFYFLMPVSVDQALS